GVADLIESYFKTKTAERAAARSAAEYLGPLTLDAHRDTHAAADAQCREPLLGVALLHLVQQGHEHARARCANRMADRYRAAVNIDLGRVPAEVLVDRTGLRREGFVRFDQIEIVDLPAGFLERRPRGGDRPGAHDRGIDAGVRPRDDAGEHFPGLLRGLARLHEHHDGGPGIDAGRLVGGNPALLLLC